MKKNGFTLIEIIGAVIILGIIAIIAFATFSGSVKDFRDIYYQKEVKTLEKSGKEFFNDNRNYRPTKVLHAQEVKISTLISKNYLNEVNDYNGDACNQESYVLIVKEDADNYSYHACLKCESDLYDNTKDDIYCDRSWLDPTKVTYGIGEMDTAYIYKGTTREELKGELELPISYVRRDNDGNIIASRRGTKEGNETIFPTNMDVVNTDVLGTYKVTYKYGEETATRDVVVYENKEPTITYRKEQTVATKIDGTTTKDPEPYHDGEWAQNVIVNLSSNTYDDPSISTSRFQWNVDGKWQDFCESDPCEVKIERELNQTVQFRIVDSNGHVSLLTDPITIRIDNTKPTCSVEIPTEIGENDWYNQPVTIRFSNKEDLMPEENDARLISGIKRYNIQKSTANLSRTITENGVEHDAIIDSIVDDDDTLSVTYIGYVEDQAENFSTCTATTFKLDDTDPTCQHDGDSKDYIATDRTISFFCEDPYTNGIRSDCNPDFSGGNLVFDTTTVTSTIPEYTIKDKAGNIVLCEAREADVYVDKTAPSCNGVGFENSTTSSVTATVGCSDANSGCKSNPFKVTGQTTSGKIEIEDNVGNKQECSYEIYLKDQYKDCSSYNTECTSYGTVKCDCATCQGECNSWSSYSNSSCYGSSNACLNGCSGSCDEVGGNCKVQCTWTTYNCNGYLTYSCDPCKTCTDYSNCLSTTNVSCNTWESNWHDASSCTPSTLDRQCQQVYRAR